MKKVIVCMAFLAAATLASAYTAVWFDGYDTSAASNDINFEYTLRQGGVPAAYVESPADPDGTDWRSQVGTALLLANDGTLPAYGDPLWGSTLASPDRDFSGVVGMDVIGTKVSFSVFVDNTAYGYSYASANFGSQLGMRDSAGTIGISLVQDNTTGGLGSFFQLYDGTMLYNASVPFTAGGWNSVEVFFTDLDGDGNPWDGGDMAVGVLVNGNAVGSFNASGWTQNYITLEGSWNFAGGTGIHYFDNLTVYSSVIPEPATLALLGLGAVGLLRKKRA